MLTTRYVAMYVFKLNPQAIHLVYLAHSKCIYSSEASDPKMRHYETIKVIIS